MTKTTPTIVKTFSKLTIYWSDAKDKFKGESAEPLILSNDTCHLTYKVKDSAINIEWSEFVKDKPAFIVRRMTIPLYNVKYIDEIIEDEEQGDESDDV